MSYWFSSNRLGNGIGLHITYLISITENVMKWTIHIQIFKCSLFFEMVLMLHMYHDIRYIEPGDPRMIWLRYFMAICRGNVMRNDFQASFFLSGNNSEWWSRTIHKVDVDYVQVMIIQCVHPTHTDIYISVAFLNEFDVNLEFDL